MKEVIVSSPMEIETSALTSSGTGPGGGSRRQGLGRSNSVNRKHNEAAPLLLYYNSSSRGGGGLFRTSSLSSLGSLRSVDNSNRSKSASKLNNNTPLNNEELALINMQRNSSRRLNLNSPTSADDDDDEKAQEAPAPEQQQRPSAPDRRRQSAPDRRRRDSMKEINENWKSEYSMNISTSLHSLGEDEENGEEQSQQKQSFEPKVVEKEEGVGVEQTYKSSNIKKKKKKRHHVNVTFDTVTVRFYNTIVGDSPSCPSGPPLSLGWKYDNSLSLIKVNIDIYEDVNTNILNVGNKKEYELVLPRPDREERLLEAGISRTEMAIATKKNFEARNLQTRTILNLQYHKQEEIFESTTRRLQYMTRVRKQHSNWLFNEWKTSKEQGYSTVKLTNWIEKQQSKYLKVHDENKKRPTSPSNNIPTTIQEKRPSTFTKEQINELKKRPPFGIVQIETTKPIKVVQQGDEHKEKEEKQEEEVLLSQQQQPFAKVDYVYMNSPVFMAGIQKGDEIIIFGNLSQNSMDYSQGQIGKCIQSQIIIKQQQQKHQKGTGTTSSGSSPTHHNTRGSGRRFNRNIDDDGIRVVIQRHSNRTDKSDDEGEVLTKFVHPSKYEGGPGNLGWLISSSST